MKQKFLEHIANHLLGLSTEQWLNTWVLLPNKRACRFLQKHLIEKVDTTAWLPEIISIEDFIFQKSGFKKASNTDLIFDLYECYLEQFNQEQNSFEEFGSFAPTLLQDFNDIDNYLADAQVVFTYLKEARALQKWNPGKDSGRMEESYLAFYNQLGQLYATFKNKLLAQHSAFPGMAIRHLIDQSSSLPENKHIIVAGFNALSPAEKSLLKKLKSQNKLEVLVDADSYYLNQKNQEAGKHLRKMIADDYIPIQVIKNKGFTHDKQIHIKGVPGNYPMVKYVAMHILNETQKPQWHPEDTAIVLPDESLLFPLLSALPLELQSLNITMSYPFKGTAPYGLAMSLFECMESMERLKKRNPEEPVSIYYKAFSQLMDNPMLKQQLGDKLKNFKRSISNANITLIRAKHLDEHHLDIFKVLFQEEMNAGKTLESMVLLMQEIAMQLDGGIELSILQELLLILSDFREKIRLYKFQESTNVLKKIFVSMTSFKGLAFEGEPLSGLQIMGVLETRALDFDHIIYLSFNEGTLPRIKQDQSYILPEIRHHFGLPLPHDDEAIMAYHFFRSIQRASHIHLIYNLTPDRFGGGEMSRFGQQMLVEMKQVQINHQQVQLPNPSQQDNGKIIIEKDKVIMQALKTRACHAEKGFSPSSLSTYLSCSLKYYYRYVLGLYEQEQVDEEMAVNIRGSAIHDTLEQLYKKESLENNRFDSTFFEFALENYQEVLEEAYRRNYFEGEVKHGYNLILSRLDGHMIERFLKKDKDYSLHTTKVRCEQKLESYFPVEVQGEEWLVRIHGSADRIDRMQGQERIIDYKTGKVDDKLELKKVGENANIYEDIFIKNKRSKTFQLMVYALLHMEMQPNLQEVLPVIAGLKQHQVFFELRAINQPVSRELIMEFKGHLISLLQEILSPELPFQETTQANTCRFCEYKSLCNK
jgi:ATP-dependent helicase/nuclease subunit B